MRKILLVVATAIFLYSPHGPSWGQFAVNMVIVVTVCLYFMKSVPKPNYREEDEEYN